MPVVLQGRLDGHGKKAPHQGELASKARLRGGTSAVSASGKPPYRLTPFGTSPSGGGLTGAAKKAPHQGEALVRAKLVGAGVPDGPFPRTKKQGNVYPFKGIHFLVYYMPFISGDLSYRPAFFFLAAVAVAVTAAADRVNRAAHRAKLLSSPVGTFVRMGISAFSV